MEKIFKKQTDSYKLDMKDLVFNISSLQNFELQNQINNLYKDEKLDLSFLLKIWNLTNQKVNNQFEKINENKNSQYIKELCSKIEGILNNNKDFYAFIYQIEYTQLHQNHLKVCFFLSKIIN